MVSSTLLTLYLLQGVAFGKLFTGWNVAPSAALSVAPVVERAAQLPRSLMKCNADNCMNVMTNTPSVASSFCSTWIQSTTVVTITPTVTILGSSTISPTFATPAITTAPKPIPTHIQSQCTLATSTPLTSRLSSACSCLSVLPSSTVTQTSYAPVTTIINPCGSLPNPYTVPGGTFDLYCGYFIFGDEIIEYDGTLPDLPSCLEACASIEGCVAVDWADDIIGVGETGCVLLADVTADIGFSGVYNFAAMSNFTLPSDLFTQCSEDDKRDLGRRCVEPY